MEKITAILLLLPLIRADESMQQYNINAPLIETITQITRNFNNNNFTSLTKSWSLPEDSQKIKMLTITLTPASTKSNHIVCNFFDGLRINLFNYEKIIGRGEFFERTNQSRNATLNKGMVQINIREPNISVIRNHIKFSTELVPSGKISVMFNLTTKHPNKEQRRQLGEELADDFTNTIKNRIRNAANPTEMVGICTQPFENAKKTYKWFSPDEHKREYYFTVDNEYIQVQSTDFSSELKLIGITMKNMTKFESMEVQYLTDNVTNYNLTIREVSGNMIQAGNGNGNGNGTERTEFNFTMDLFQLIMNYSITDTPTDVKVRTNGFTVKSFNNERFIREAFEKTTASFMKRALSSATNTDTNTTTDFMADYTITPEHDVTNSFVNALKEMTIDQFGNQTSPNQILSTEKKDKIIKSTYNFKSEKIMYRLDMTWKYDAVAMSVGKPYSDSYFGLSLKSMKVQGTWEYKPKSDDGPCTGKIKRTFSDIDSLLDILLKLSINNTAAAKSEIESDELIQNIALDQNCKDQNRSKTVVRENLKNKSYLKILTMALEVIPSLYEGNANTELVPSTGDSYAYFINDNDTTSGYNDEVMIRGLHQLKKITVQYPDYGQVTNASEFKIPMWRANVSWFRCNEKERPMHMDVETEYLILKGNISGEIGNVGIEFNLPDTISINGHSKKVDDGDKNKLKELQVLIRDVINQTSAKKETMLKYNINSPLIHTITHITRQFNNKNFMNIANNWSSTSDNSRTISISNFKITPTPTPSKSNHTVCKFNDSLRINLFNYEKIIGRGENCGEYGRIGQSKNSNELCKFQIFIREPNISAIHKSTESPFTELKPSGKNLLIFNFSAKHPNKSRRQDLGKALNDAFTDMIKYRIGRVANPIEMVGICKQPFENSKKTYKWFSPDQYEREYYFAVDDEYIDPKNFPLELKLVDIMMKNITKFESVEVRYLSDDLTNFNLSIRNVWGNMIQAGNGKEPTELNFAMDLFQMIMNYNTTDTLTDVKVRTNGFKVKPSNNETLIREVFEKTTADFMKRALGSLTKEDPMPSNASLTQSGNGPSNVIGIEYLNTAYDIADQTAFTIAKILWDFHYITESQTSESNETRFGNVTNDLYGIKLTDISMTYTILGIQDQTCDFEKIFRANYQDIYVVLKGSITAKNISNKYFPFSLLINSLSISKEKDDSSFLIEMIIDDKRIYVNTGDTDIDSSDMKTMKDIIRFYMEPILERSFNDSWRFSGLFDTCIHPVMDVVKNKAETEKYFYLISNPGHNQSFHLPLRINYIAIWGFFNYNSIKTTKVSTGTTFQFVVKNLVARVNWSYSYHYEENAWSNSTQLMDLHGGFISLTGRIDTNKSTLKWEESRLIFKISILPPPKKKTITVEKIMHKVNETMLYHIQTSIENNFNSLRKKLSTWGRGYWTG